jgi:hypothetical protein
MISKLIILITGGIFLLIGLIMLITPGPGIIFIAMGLGILGLKFPGAKKIVQKLNSKFNKKAK